MLKGYGAAPPPSPPTKPISGAGCPATDHTLLAPLRDHAGALSSIALAYLP